LFVAILSRYSSLSAIVGAVVTPIWLLTVGDCATALLAAALSLILIYKHRTNIHRLIAGHILIYKHRTNIHRLIAGQEPRIGVKA
jgi:glycerol-3-phosphate acyltransferase PlsY